ncbi:hypothetical protein OHV13_29745 [Kitasatospora purpeofusca]|uniref:hypothetical protein n=1 Tax=Kitasatospora purpeofusca TaxID=67352 RepID=UPI00324B2E3A
MTVPDVIAHRVWRPYDDAPLITREMISGLDSCDPVARKRLLAYLEAVVSQRAVPVHTAVAFNAIYFGYDLSAGGYVGGPLDIGDFPSVSLGEQVEALPVGAMINIRTGGDLLPAEVVYKEGAHSELGPYGEVPAWLSGAPAGARGPGVLDPDEAPILRERLVFDTTAFGQDLAPTVSRLQRLRRQGRTDEFEHLVVESRYALVDADLGDAEYYARYLVTRGRAQLTSALAPSPLPSLIAPGSGDDGLLEAIRGLMATVRQGLASLDTARVWGEYAFTRESMARRLLDTCPPDRDDLLRLAESVSNQAVPRGARRVGAGWPKPVYTAVGPVLRSRASWQDRIRGADYPLAVCHANSVLSDYARRERDETTGLLASGVRLGLDDRWQGGGVWRAVYVGDAVRAAPAEGSVDAPVGRGWTDSFPPRAVVPEPSLPQDHRSVDAEDLSPQTEVEEFTPGPWPDDSDLGASVLLSADDSQVEWAQPLRLSHVLEQYLPLPRQITEEFRTIGAAAGSVRVVLHHAGQELPADRACHDTSMTEGEGGVRLDGLAWPPDLFPGIWLSFTWLRGSRVVYARTTLLPHPVTVDGDLIRHRYDPMVFTRDWADGQPVSAQSPNDFFAERLLMTAVRRLGLLDQFGRAMLARTDVPAAVDAVMDGSELAADRVEAVMVGLLAAECLTVARGSRGSDGRTYHPPRTGQPLEELVCYTPRCVKTRGGASTDGRDQDTSAAADQQVHGHDVAGFIRRIGHLGHQATDEQRALYHADHRRFRLTGPAELPPGFTYVRPHKRGR